jgi:hypothetical protein
MDSRLGTTIALAAATLTACSDAADRSELLAPGHGIEASAAHPAGDEGAVIVRRSAVEFLVLFDADEQLLSVHMPSTVCTISDLNEVDLLQVITPSTTDQLVSLLSSGDVQVAVYSAASPMEAGFGGSLDLQGFGNLVSLPQLCAFLSGPNRIAEGSARRISAASNASFHLSTTGTLQGVEGGEYHLDEVYQLNADAHDPNNPATFVEHRAEIDLQRIR